jgi:exodeoxyribonuclease V
MGGFAGSGKSTLISLVAESLPPPVAFAAYTGKASSVLKRKLTAAGIFTVGTQPRKDGRASLEQRPYCGTIHSLIYRPCECREPKRIDVQKPCPIKDCVGETRWTTDGSVCTQGHRGHYKSEKEVLALKKTTKTVPPPKVDGRCSICFDKGWLKREVLDRDYSMIILDEASMIDSTILRDLQSYGVPMLAVGDHGQLPPVGGAGELMKSPMLRLEKIHRQAEGNPIIALSKMIRETGRLPDSLPGDAVTFGALRFVERAIEERYAGASPERLLQLGAICYTNRRRLGLNTMIRRVRGAARTGRELPRKGEHVVCLRNMKGRGVDCPPIYNGMRGVLMGDADYKKNINETGEEIGRSQIHLQAAIEFPDDEISAIEFDNLFAPQFCREKTFNSPEELGKETGVHSFGMAGALFDFGFAMTCHKMQGSQCEDLLVLAERPGPVDEDTWKKWLYTAVTRSASKLTVLR